MYPSPSFNNYPQNSMHHPASTTIHQYSMHTHTHTHTHILVLYKCQHIIHILHCLLFYVFFFFVREKQTGHERGRGRERGRHRIRSRLQSPSCQHRAWRRARTHKLWDYDLSWSQAFDWLSHPGAPPLPSFLKLTCMMEMVPYQYIVSSFSLVSINISLSFHMYPIISVE